VSSPLSLCRPTLQCRVSSPQRLGPNPAGSPDDSEEGDDTSDLDDLIWEAESDSDEEDIDEGMDYSWFEGVHTGKTTRLSRQWSNLAVDLLRACAEQQNKKCSIPPRDVPKEEH
ncbi:hypothetical protein FOZ63_030084, partial [Perkinsus olseni]